MKLTEKQKRFVDFFIETGNKTEAAKRAGYSEKTAASIGDENLRKPAIKAAIEARLKELEDKRIAKIDEVLKFLTSSMRGELTDEQIVVEGAGDGISSARIIETRVSVRERIEAAKSLLKRYPMELDVKEQQLRLAKLEQSLKAAEKQADDDDVQIIDDIGDVNDEENQTD